MKIVKPKKKTKSNGFMDRLRKGVSEYDAKDDLYKRRHDFGDFMVNEKGYCDGTFVDHIPKGELKIVK